MSNANVDLTRKIQYAEEWLSKAKSEISSGSSTMAASHIILAIAEMETLKQAIIRDDAPMDFENKQSRVRALDIRPYLAVAMLLIAFGIFLIAPRYMNTEPVTQSAMNESHFDSFFGAFNERESVFAPFEDSLPIAPNTDEIDNTQNQPMIASAQPIDRKPVTTSARQPRKNIEITLVAKEEIETPSLVVADNSWLITPNVSELNTKEISFEAAVAARESLTVDND